MPKQCIQKINDNKSKVAKRAARKGFPMATAKKAETKMSSIRFDGNVDAMLEKMGICEAEEVFA